MQSRDDLTDLVVRMGFQNRTPNLSLSKLWLSELWLRDCCRELEALRKTLLPFASEIWGLNLDFLYCRNNVNRRGALGSYIVYLSVFNQLASGKRHGVLRISLDNGVVVCCNYPNGAVFAFAPPSRAPKIWKINKVSPPVIIFIFQ